jgi:hypothetical protein
MGTSTHTDLEMAQNQEVINKQAPEVVSKIPATRQH